MLFRSRLRPFPAPFLRLADRPSNVLTKDLLQVSRRGGGYQPQFADASHEELAARVIGCYQGHVDQPRERLQEALTEIERESDDFKLVRGFSKLLDRDATWEIRSPVDPERARKAAFAAGEAVGVVTEDDRGRALDRAADHLGTTPETVKRSLYADLDRREVLSTVEQRGLGQREVVPGHQVRRVPAR